MRKEIIQLIIFPDSDRTLDKRSILIKNLSFKHHFPKLVLNRMIAFSYINCVYAEHDIAERIRKYLIKNIFI
jgi:hypothetical protein